MNQLSADLERAIRLGYERRDRNNMAPTIAHFEAVRVFLAMSLNDAGRSDAAVAQLSTVITAHGEVTDLGHYADGLRGYAEWLTGGRPAG
jgi:hypothetical protein